jgi:hypothetical protein
LPSAWHDALGVIRSALRIIAANTYWPNMGRILSHLNLAAEPPPIAEARLAQTRLSPPKVHQDAEPA